MTPDEFRRAGHELIDFIADYLSRRVETLPVSAQVRPGDIAARMPHHPPQHAESWDAIRADIERVVMPGLTHWQHPSFFGYFPATGSFPAILGDLLSTGLCVNGFLWATSPAMTEVETRVLDWLGEMIGLPEEFLFRSGRGGGVIHGTASEAVLTAMVAARHRALRRRPGAVCTAYASSQAHSSVVKAAMVCGIGRDHLRIIEVDDKLAMRTDALAQAMAADAAAGRAPAFVCATVGTTSTGAVDPLRAIGEVARRFDAWLHVDAAYAGAACICPEHRGIIDGVGSADSFNFNPHKWLLTNFDCSAFWVRDRNALVEALSVTPEYLRNPATESGAVIDYRDWQIPLGRRFRALKLWFVIRHYGTDGLRSHIRESVRLAELFESLVRSDERFEVPLPRSLGLFCMRLRAGDAPTRRLLDRLNESGAMLLTHTVVTVGGVERFLIRVAVGGPATREAHVRDAWSAMVGAADEVLR